MAGVVCPRNIVDDGRQGLRNHTATMMRRNLLVHHERSERPLGADHPGGTRAREAPHVKLTMNIAENG